MAGAAAPKGCGAAGKLAALALGAARPAAEQLKTGKAATGRITGDDLVRDFKAELRVGWFF